MAKLADGLVTLGLIVLGLVLMATPLAIWVAWSGTMLVIVLATGAAAGVLYCVLVRFEKPAAPAPGDASRRVRRATLSDDAMEEVRKLHPLVHHNRRSGSPEFRGAMDRLKKHLGERRS